MSILNPSSPLSGGIPHDDTLTLSDVGLGVTTPVQGVYTQAEYDALPEAQKNKGLYVIPGGATGGVTMDDVNAAIDEKLDAYQPMEVYSAEETRIGTWIDGKPLYRKAYRFTGPSNISEQMLGSLEIANLERISNYYGTAYISSRQDFFALNFVYPGAQGALTDAISIFIRGGNIYGRVSASWLYGADFIVIIEYTKTTDAAN